MFQFGAVGRELFVGFQFGHADFARSDAGHGARSLDGQPQRFGVRRMVRHADAADDRVDAVAVAAGVGQSLEDDHAHPFGRHDPVVAGVEDQLGGLVRGQQAGVVQCRESIRVPCGAGRRRRSSCRYRPTAACRRKSTVRAIAEVEPLVDRHGAAGQIRAFC